MHEGTRGRSATQFSFCEMVPDRYKSKNENSAGHSEIVLWPRADGNLITLKLAVTISSVGNRARSVRKLRCHAGPA